MVGKEGSYLTVEYPHGVNKTYVYLLCDYLVKRFNLKGDLLDVGAGTGDYFQTFRRMGLRANPSEGDLEYGLQEPLGSYDIVFGKSVLEHIWDTEGFLRSVYDVLKPGGRVLFLVPDWNSQWKYFYDDSTHIKPFTRKGLKQALDLTGFSAVQCEYFLQLPFTWRHRWLKWLPYILRFVPDRFRYLSLHIRFSKEKMLLCVAYKS